MALSLMWHALSILALYEKMDRANISPEPFVTVTRRRFIGRSKRLRCRGELMAFSCEETDDAGDVTAHRGRGSPQTPYRVLSAVPAGTISEAAITDQNIHDFMSLDRKISVAPMMDWTDGREFAC